MLSTHRAVFTHRGIATPSSSSASTSWSTSPEVWSADRAIRSRQVPSATVGGRMAGTRRPRSTSAWDTSSARDSVPSSTGTIGLGWPGTNRSTLDRSCATSASPSADVTMPTAAVAAAMSAGVDAVVKMNGRAALMHRSMTARGPATNPPSDPRVFDSVPTTTRSHAGSDGVAGPSTAWASSRTDERVVASADRPPGPSTSAASPSIEKTESDTTSAWRAVRSRSRTSSRPRSEWGNTIDVARARRTPSMIEAWFSSSLRITVSSAPAAAVSAPSTPRLAANPVGNTRADSVPFQPRARPPSSSCAGRPPTISRDAPEPVPYRRSRRARRPRRRDAGTGRGSRSTRSGRLGAVGQRRCGPTRRRADESCATDRASASGVVRASADGVERMTPRLRIPRADPPAFRAGHVRDRLGHGRHDPFGLVRRGGEQRHDDHDVAERADEHAAGDTTGAHPSSPAEPVGGRIELDADHQSVLADLGAPRATAHPSASSAANCRGGPSTLASTSPSRSSRRWASATAAARAFPP